MNIKRNGNRKNYHNNLKKIPKDYSIIFHKVFDKLKCKKIINTLKTSSILSKRELLQAKNIYTIGVNLVYSNYDLYVKNCFTINYDYLILSVSGNNHVSLSIIIHN